MGTADFISCTDAGTLFGLFQRRVARTPDATAYEQYDPVEKRWVGYTWRDVENQVARWRHALASEGLAPQDRIAVWLPNSVEWVVLDQAALSLQLVVVPLYAGDNPDSIAHVLQDSGSRLLFVSKVRQWRELSKRHALFPQLNRVLCLEKGTVSAGTVDFQHVADWLPPRGERMATVPADPDAMATIVYTSGTTGRAKGVMLSHRNILWDAEATWKMIPAYREDVFLSFLPLSHMLERTLGYYLPMMAGSRIVYARSTKALAEDLVTVRPTVLISVPRIYERVYATIREHLAQKGPLARRLSNWTLDIGWSWFEHTQGRGTVGPAHRMLWQLLRYLVAEPILARFGGRVRLSITGGGPVEHSIARYFLALGLPLLQGYGLTEASPVVSGNRPDRNSPDSVGEPLPGVEVTIGAGGELLVRSANVMLGYWQRPEDTRSAIDEKGWLHTGDIAEIRGNQVFIRGRIKEILVTSTGEKVPLGDLEMSIVQDPLFEQAMVIGEGRPFIAALLVLERAAWRSFAAQRDVDPENTASLQMKQIVNPVLERIRERLRGFPSYAQVRAVSLSLDPWTVENGLVTATLKLRRKLIQERFAGEIDRLYERHGITSRRAQAVSR
jgi:long-chain acyl-CoA synthetase